MFDLVTIRVSDHAASERFYTVVLAALGIGPGACDAGAVRWQDFAIARAADGARVTRRLHIGFVAASRADVDAFWRAGLAGGYRDDGAPGPRPRYRPDYYGAFLLDPDGNSAEAVHHGALRAGGVIDHLWIRVADVAAAAAFYETIAPHAGFNQGRLTEDHAWFQGASGSFSLVTGEPTQHVHMAFPAADGAKADVIGAPMLDPDGNTVEIVERRA